MVVIATVTTAELLPRQTARPHHLSELEGHWERVPISFASKVQGSRSMRMYLQVWQDRMDRQVS